MGVARLLWFVVVGEPPVGWLGAGVLEVVGELGDGDAFPCEERVGSGVFEDEVGHLAGPARVGVPEGRGAGDVELGAGSWMGFAGHLSRSRVRAGGSGRL